MFLARIHGTLTATAKHATLNGARFLLGQRLEVNGQPAGDPLIIIDSMGACRGTTVLVSTDGDILRTVRGNTTPARLTVVGLIDEEAAR